MAEDDFEIDIYGDEAADQQDGKPQNGNGEEYHGGNDRDGHDISVKHEDSADQEYYDGEDHYDGQDRHGGDTDSGTARENSKPPQELKHKSESEPDERRRDPNATSALVVSDLNWWDTDDDIRGWARQAGAEGDLHEIMFSEHKANGKSKG
jgi:hypothetical protein